MTARRSRKKVVFLTADQLDEQADRRASEAEQLPEEGETERDSYRSAVESVRQHETRARTTNHQIEIVAADREFGTDSTMSDGSSDGIRSFRRQPGRTSIEVDTVARRAGIVFDLRDDEQVFELPVRLSEQRKRQTAVPDGRKGVRDAPPVSAISGTGLFVA